MQSKFSSRGLNEPLAKSIDGPITGLVLVGLSGICATVVSHVETNHLFTYGHSIELSYALDIEQRYLDGLLDFQEPPAPEYSSLNKKELARLASLFDMDRVLCAVISNAQGEIAGGRNYRGAEMTRMVQLRAEIAKHAGLLINKFEIPGINYGRN